jgi:hypothetical protein
VDQTELFNPFAGWFGSAAPTPEGAALDLLTTVRKITVVRDPPSPLLKPRPIGVFLVPVPQAIPKVLTLAPGQVLLASRQLAASGPDAITGFEAASGTLTFQANVTVVSGVIRIPAAQVVQLDAVLKAPPAPAPGSGPGADARAVAASLPASITIQFKNTGGEITKLPDFGVTVYGTNARLVAKHPGPEFRPGPAADSRAGECGAGDFLNCKRPVYAARTERLGADHQRSVGSSRDDRSPGAGRCIRSRQRGDRLWRGNGRQMGREQSNGRHADCCDPRFTGPDRRRAARADPALCRDV